MKFHHALWVSLLVAPSLRAAEDPSARAAAPTPTCPAGTKHETTYPMILAGNRAGALVTCTAKDGALVSLFAFNDRGRGPSTTTKTRLDSHGLPTLVETSGNDYYKKPVTERFTLTGGKAAWTNKAEKGAKTLDGPAYYVGYSSPPNDTVLLAAALAKAKDGRLALLPEGEARLEKRGELTVTAGGKTRRLLHEAIVGLSFAPIHVWRDADGGVFGAVSSWSSFVPEGFESVVADLQKAQDEDDAKHDTEAAKRLARHPSGAVAITGARLFDSIDASVRPGRTVVIEGNRIVAVGPDGGVAIPEHAERIDAKGRTLMPGLWDMHVHLGHGDGLMHLAGGVTSVRDLANDMDTLLAMEKRFDSGEELGPRVVRAGFIDGPGPFQGPTKILASTPEEIRGFIKDYASKGYVQIKLYSSLKPELVPVAAEEAHRLGLRLSGHIPAFMTAEQAVRAGYDEIQHVNMLFLNFWFDDVKDTRTPARFTALAERSADLDLASPKVKDFIALLRDRHTVVDLTDAAFETLLVDRPGQVSVELAAIAPRFPPQVRRGLMDGGLPVPEGKDARYKASFEKLLAMTKALEDAGVPIVAGTDDMAGFFLAHELELYVRAGIPAARVLQIATRDAARVAGKEAVLGSIMPGKLADVILVDGDPAAKISDIRNVSLVIKDGVLYDPDALTRELGMSPRK
jgi:imidazolonepropionase-like amidohydrolase